MDYGKPKGRMLISVWASRKLIGGTLVLRKCKITKVFAVSEESPLSV